MATCRFCDIAEARLFETEFFVAVYDAYPVNPGHLLLISKEHVQTLFDLSPSQVLDLQTALTRAKALLDQERAPNGYNVGANCGSAAGQTVPHFHLHLIPRYSGDVEEPRGGVRNIKPALVPY